MAGGYQCQTDTRDTWSGRRACLNVGGAREERGRGQRGEGARYQSGRPTRDRNDTIGEEGGREQKDGGNERKSKEENQENQSYIRDCTEEEWDEELKSI